MTVEELGHECEKYDCDDCPYMTKCHKVQEILYGISMEALLRLLKRELD